MKPLAELADSISAYNLMGRAKLPMFKLAIVQTQEHNEIAQHILSELSCHETHSFAQIVGIGGCHSFRSQTVHNLEVFLIDSIYGHEAIEDREFLKRKKIFDTFRFNREVYMLYLSQEQINKSTLEDRSQLMALKRVDHMAKKELVWKDSLLVLFREIAKVWETMNRVKIINCLEDMKAVVKECRREEKRQLEWLQQLSNKVDPLSFAFHLNYVCKSYIVNSFEGYYSPQNVSFPHKYSVHWQIMDILEDLWKEQGDTLKDELEKMPLSYIQEMLRMNDFNSIGGFLPESCFLKIFKPLLDRFGDATIQCLEAAKYKIIQNVQMVYEYYYSKTNIKHELIELQVHHIEQICDQFLSQVTNAINSQINYVYAPAQTFWEMRSIKSHLYSAEQQANIQIKYIGKIYVRKVFESIRQSVPRYLGQGLLRKISRYISQNSMQHLMTVINETPIAITLTSDEIEDINHKQQRKKECEKLINYFSLKVHSTYLIKNLHNKIDRRWKQMFDEEQAEQGQTTRKSMLSEKREGGFFNWMKRLFKSDEPQNRVQRANSIQKSAQIQEPMGTKSQLLLEDLPKFEATISDKAWILILYSNKKISQTKLLLTSCQGFSQKLRPSIWYWLSTRDNQSHVQSKISSVIGTAQINPDTARQIEKDLGRTPPSFLFRKKYRSSLRNVLSAYSLTDQQIGYTQGMNFLAGTIICTLLHYGIKDDYLMDSIESRHAGDLEDRSFTIFRFMMEKTGFRKMMLIERGHIAQLCYRIQSRIKQLNMFVFQMIQESGFNCEIIFGPLLISGLLTWSNQLPIKQRIFDITLLRGVEALYNVVAGVAAMSESELAKMKNQQVYDFLRNKALDVFYDKVGNKGLTELFLTF